MGASSSTAILTQVNETINETTFDFISSKTSSATGKTVSTQKMDVNGVQAYSCELSITQSSSIEQSVIQQITQEDAVDLATKLSTAVNNVANTSADSTSSFGATGSTDSYTSQEIQNKVTNVIKNSVTSTTVNEIINEIYNSQTLAVSNVIIDPCGYSLWMDKLNLEPPDSVIAKCNTDKKCSITQDTAIKSISIQIANMVTTAIQDDEILGSLIQSATSSASAANKGPIEALGDALSGIIGSFGSGGGVVILIIIVAVVILIIMMKK